MRHLLVTRYDLGLWDWHADPEAWLRHRAALFAERTVPSVEAQRGAEPLEWWLFVDERTPAGRIPEGPYRRIACDARWTDGLPSALPWLRRRLAEVCEPGELLVTQRLDNDDAIHERLAATVQREARRAARLPCVIDPIHGSVASEADGVRPRTDPMSAFVAFAEPVPERGEPVTVWIDSHRKLADYGERIVVESLAPAWEQTWHDENLFNGRGVRGRASPVRP